MSDKMRTFETGAVRSDDSNKLNYEACLSPLVLQRYAEYIRSHRKLPDGSMRTDDNWQKGFGLKRWMEAKWRHFMATWWLYRCHPHLDAPIEETLCAELFNTMGMLHEILKKGDMDVSPSSKIGECTGRRNIISLLRGLLSFVRAAQSDLDITEQAMTYEAAIEDVLEKDLGQIAKGISNVGAKPQDSKTPEAFLDKNIGCIT